MISDKSASQNTACTRIECTKRTFPARNTNASGFHLEAKGTLVLPQGRRNTRLYSGRSNLTCRVKRVTIGAIRHPGLADTWKRQDRLGSAQPVGDRRACRGAQPVGVRILTPILRRSSILARTGLQQGWLGVLVGMLMRVRRGDRLRRRCWAGGHVLRIIHLGCAVHCWEICWCLAGGWQ